MNKSAYHRAYYLKNREKQIAAGQARYFAKKTEISLYRKLKYAANRETVLARFRVYAKANPDKIRERSKRYRENNADRIKQINAAQYQKNIEARKQYSRDWHEAKRRPEPGYVYAIRGASGVKIGRTIQKPADRVRAILTGDPSAKLLIALWVSDMFAETLIHRRFKSQRVAREWFNLTDSEAVSAINNFAPQSQQPAA